MVLQSQQTFSLLITLTISLIIQIDKFNYRFDLETVLFASFPSKKFSYTAIILFLQKVSTLSIPKFTISTRTDIMLQTSGQKLRAIRMCSRFTPDDGYDTSAINLIADVYCPKTKCSGKLCLLKKTFQVLDRSDYHCLRCTSACQVRSTVFSK